VEFDLKIYVVVHPSEQFALPFFSLAENEGGISIKKRSKKKIDCH